MKKSNLFLMGILGIALAFGRNAVFGLENEPPAILIEPIGGRSFGNIQESISFDVRLSYPFKVFGVSIEAGTIGFSSFHLFLGPLVQWNYGKMRVLGAIGFDFFLTEDTSYNGAGSFVEMSYRFSKNFYIAFGVEVNVDFHRSRQEIVGYTDAATGILPDGTKVYPIGPDKNPILTKPVIENVGQFGAFYVLKPFLAVGFQY